MIESRGLFACVFLAAAAERKPRSPRGLWFHPLTGCPALQSTGARRLLLCTAPFQPSAAFYCPPRSTTLSSNRSLPGALSLEAESKQLAGQVTSAKRECSRLERDLEEGSRRLAMAHREIRHLTDQLESAHLSQRAYGQRHLSAIPFRGAKAATNVVESMLLAFQ